MNTLTTWNTLSLSLEEYMTYGARIEHEWSKNRGMMEDGGRMEKLTVE